MSTASCGGGSSGATGCADAFLFSPRGPEAPEDDVESELATAGPYEYGIVRADAKQPLLDWLNENRFFVPTEIEDVLDPYIRSGAYFLALKLRAGESVGSLQPVVLDYPSELPMIPLILTSASAVRDMPVLVWVLGEHRAVPHNFSHVTINEAYVDWFGGAQNYAEVVARAIDESPKGHGFVTELAGPTDPMRNALMTPDRFPDRSVLDAATSLLEYRRLTIGQDWPRAALAAVLARYDESNFDAVAIADELWERIVGPTAEAQRLFDTNSTMTRLHTALDPLEMTADPVFAFNPDLFGVSRTHTAGWDSCDNSGTLTLGDGRELEVSNRSRWDPVQAAEGQPRALAVSMLRMEGQPEYLVDHREALLDKGGCRSLGRGWQGGMQFLILVALVAVGRWPLRRKTKSRSGRGSSSRERPTTQSVR